jgi:lipid A 4'-phosphatase
VAVVGFVAAGATGRVALWLPQRAWGFILALYILAPGLLVNAGLKSHWGRARPAAVQEFGGTAQFTPALQPADECLRNCSFVSGEASAAAALAISVAAGLYVLRGRMAPVTLRAGLWAAFAVAVLGSLLRLATGRHFLSDVVFAWLLTAGVALVLWVTVLQTRAAASPVLRHG